MARQKVKSGDVFVIPLRDATEALGQVVSLEPQALNSVGCLLWPSREGDIVEQLGMPPIAGVLLTPDLLKSGQWPIIGNESVQFSRSRLPYEKYRNTKWVGAKIVGSGNVVEFLCAFRGLRYWDEWADPLYLNNLLLPGIQVPSHAKFKHGS